MYRIVAVYNNKNVYYVSKTTDADADDDAVMLHVVSRLLIWDLDDRLEDVFWFFAMMCFARVEKIL